MPLFPFVVAVLLVVVGCREEDDFQSIASPAPDSGCLSQKLKLEPNKLTTRALKGFAFLDARHGLAVGKQGRLLSTQDGGKTWRMEKSAFSADLNRVVAAGNRYWIVGNAGTFLEKEVDSPPVPHAVSKADLYALCFADERNGLVAGADGTILETGDGGKTWASSPSPEDQAFDAVAVQPGNKTYWVVGNNGRAWKRGVSAKSDSWTRVEIGTERFLSAVAFLDEKIGFVGGEKGALFKTTDGGLHWKKIGSSAASWIYCFDLADRQNLLATEGLGNVYCSKDMGETWSGVAIVKSELFDLHSPTGDPADWLAVGGSGTIIVGRGKGSWQVYTPTGENLLAVDRCGDVLRVGESRGMILKSTDGGTSWAREFEQGGDTPYTLHFFSDTSAWISSKDSLRRIEVGPSGKPGGHSVQPPSGVKEIHAFAAPDEKELFLADQNNRIFFSDDAGTSWRQCRYDEKGDPPGDINAFFFLGSEIWVAGDNGTILLATREKDPLFVREPIEGDTNFNAFAMPAPHKKWVVGSGGSVFSLTSQGIWTNTFANPQADDLMDVAMTDENNGVAVGVSGTVRQTADGGLHWTGVDSGIAEREEVQLNAVSFFRKGDRLAACIVGDDGLILHGAADGKVPGRALAARCEGRGDDVILEWKTDEESPDRKAWDVSYEYARPDKTQVKDDLSDQASVSMEKADGGSRYSLKWSPAERAISAGAKITYYAAYRKDGLYRQPYVLGTFVYRPQGLPSWAEGALAVGAILAAYWAACAALYAWAPLWLHRLHGYFPVGDLLGESHIPLAKALLKPFSEILALSWLLQKPRAIAAWCEEYAAGRAALDDLGRPTRLAYLSEDLFLDAWVRRHRAAYQEAFFAISAVKQRRHFIPLPVALEDGGQRADAFQLDALSCRARLGPSRCVIQIEGVGGAGKTTLAVELARWLLAVDDRQRLFEWDAFPLWIEEDAPSLAEAVASELAILLREEVPPDVVRALLERRRLVPIADGLTEREDETQRHWRRLYSSWEVGLCIVTTRRAFPIDGAASVTTIRPEPLRVDRLLPFVCRYLDNREERGLLTDETAVWFHGRLIALIARQNRPVEATPLLVILMLEKLLARLKEGLGTSAAPDTIPGIYLEYLRRLTGAIGLFDEVNGELQELAFRCLTPNWIPQPIPADQARETLQALGQEAWAPRLDAYCRSGVLEKRPGAALTMYRFALDPLAEYLAALCALRKAQAGDWTFLTETFPSDDGGLSKIAGFLLALGVCADAGSIQLPERVEAAIARSGARESA